jgi:hypothetical protein
MTADEGLPALRMLEIDYAGYAYGLALVGRVSGQGPRMFALAAESPKGTVPLGLALVCDQVRFQGEATQFVWLLSKAPDQTYVNPATGFSSKGSSPGLIGVGLLFALLNRGTKDLGHSRLLLHASPLGGPGLLNWYQAVGMELVPSSVPLTATRKNDGRYLRFSQQGGQAFLARFAADFL